MKRRRDPVSRDWLGARLWYFAPDMPKLRTFLALDGNDRIATFEAMAELLWAKYLVHSVPPRHWRSRFGPVAQAPAEHDLNPGRLTTTRRVRLAIDRARRNIPTDPNCLPQALAARRMLARRGIAADLYLGTLRDDAGVPRFHAWLKVGSEWVTGQCDESRYSLLAGQPSEAV